MKRKISILGATGSIGASTLNLIDETQVLGKTYEIVALTGGSNVEKLIELAKKYRPEITVIADEKHYSKLKEALASEGLECAAGEQAICEAASRKSDWLMAAIVGIAGLAPVWAALESTKILALANKEALVCAGEALMKRARAHATTLLPVDSEHNALFQVFSELERDRIDQLILTASGGPFLGYSLDQLAKVTLAEALCHPRWEMGAKITIDSASLANKGLELIEAAYLFEWPYEKIDVIVHPQSIIHSMIKYYDGSYLAQLGCADMRVPISYCLGWPLRMNWRAPMLDFTKVSRLDFSPPDLDAFPMLNLAKEALKLGAHGPIIYNAANEMANLAFRNGQIKFIEIAHWVEKAIVEPQFYLNSSEIEGKNAIEGIRDLDSSVRNWLNTNV